MTIPPDDRPAWDPRLRRLMSDAVADVEPRDALTDIRAAVHAHTQETPVPTSSSSRWTYALTGALLAAAVIVAVFLIFDPSGGGDDDPGTAASATDRNGSGQDKPTKAASASPTAEPSDASTADPSGDPTGAGGEEGTAAVYYVADTRAGVRLFREFQTVTGTDGFTRALAALQGDPVDPDYRTLWPQGSLVDVAFDGTGADGLLQVSIADASLRAIPSGMDEATARAAIEQVVYTLQGAAQARAAVQFLLDGQPVDQVYGVPTAEPLTNGSVLETLNLVSVTSPDEGSTQSGSLDLSGVGNSFEATITWQIQDSGGEVVKKGFTTSEGWIGDKLYPWSDTADISGLPAGDYLFTASTDDPTGGTEGPGPAVDTKRFTITWPR